LPELVRPHVLGGEPRRLLDPFRAGLRPLRLQDPFEDAPACRTRESREILRGGRQRCQRRSKVGRHFQAFHAVEPRPGAVRFRRLDLGPSGGGEQAGRGKSFDPRLVGRRPRAAGLARRQEQHGSRSVQLPRQAVDPAETQGLLDDRIVGKVHLSGRHLVGDEPDALGTDVVGLQPGPECGATCHFDALERRSCTSARGHRSPPVVPRPARKAQNRRVRAPSQALQMRPLGNIVADRAPGYGSGETRRWSGASMSSLRARVHRHLEPSAWPHKGLSPVNRALAILILVAVLFAVLETEPTIVERRSAFLSAIEAVFTLVFLAEYLVRIWIAPEKPRYAGRFGRLRYMVSIPALIDLLAILPGLFVFVGSEAFVVRLFRLLRILRLARLGRFSQAIHAITAAVQSRQYELLMSLTIAGILLLVSSTLLYLIEGTVQPDRFGSIPRAMWWSIATLTTVGYGDVFPITPLGRILAGFTAITGIGLIAMPTGILAAAFSDAIQMQRKAEQEERTRTEAE
jgi:voltage-gated potassium channel